MRRRRRRREPPRWGVPGVIFKASFTDLDFGDWQGMPLREVKEKYPAMYRIWRERPGRREFPGGGETLKQVRIRAWQGLLGVLQDNPEKTVLIVSHRVITKLLICAALGLDESHFWQVKQDTTAINCLGIRQGTIRGVSAQRHLPPETLSASSPDERFLMGLRKHELVSFWE